MKIIKASISGILFTIIVSPEQAFDGITYYGTTIGNKDRTNSRGQKLTSPRAVLRQDRANYHLFGFSDEGDQGDSYFSNPDHRTLFNSARLEISPGLANQLVNGPPTRVTVFVYQDKIEVVHGSPSGA